MNTSIQYKRFWNFDTIEIWSLVIGKKGHLDYLAGRMIVPKQLWSTYDITKYFRSLHIENIWQGF